MNDIVEKTLQTMSKVFATFGETCETDPLSATDILMLQEAVIATKTELNDKVNRRKARLEKAKEIVSNEITTIFNSFKEKTEAPILQTAITKAKDIVSNEITTIFNSFNNDSKAFQTDESDIIVDSESDLCKIHGIIHELTLLSQSLGSAEKELQLLEHVARIANYLCENLKATKSSSTIQSQSWLPNLIHVFHLREKPESSPEELILTDTRHSYHGSLEPFDNIISYDDFEIEHPRYSDELSLYRRQSTSEGCVSDLLSCSNEAPIDNVATNLSMFLETVEYTSDTVHTDSLFSENRSFDDINIKPEVNEVETAAGNDGLISEIPSKQDNNSNNVHEKLSKSNQVKTSVAQDDVLSELEQSQQRSPKVKRHKARRSTQSNALPDLRKERIHEINENSEVDARMYEGPTATVSGNERKKIGARISEKPTVLPSETLEVKARMDQPDDRTFSENYHNEDEAGIYNHPTVMRNETNESEARIYESPIVLHNETVESADLSDDVFRNGNSEIEARISDDGTVLPRPTLINKIMARSNLSDSLINLRNHYSKNNSKIHKGSTVLRSDKRKSDAGTSESTTDLSSGINEFEADSLQNENRESQPWFRYGKRKGKGKSKGKGKGKGKGRSGKFRTEAGSVILQPFPSTSNRPLRLFSDQTLSRDAKDVLSKKSTKISAMHQSMFRVDAKRTLWLCAIISVAIVTLWLIVICLHCGVDIQSLPNADCGKFWRSLQELLFSVSTTRYHHKPVY